ncbi:MAG: site-specific integrase [Pirellulaceae bacterium]|nr:site-specific integrase [Pirellulaceae bacterium]
MQQDLQLNGKGARTQESYLRAVRKFAEFFGNSPDSATEDDLRRYLLYVKNEQAWDFSTLNVAHCELKFFFLRTCPRDWPTLKKLKVKMELKLPTVLSIDETQVLLRVIEKPAMKCFFTVVYALGLRLQEALQLQVSDIDSARTMVHVHRGKECRDRLVPLPNSTLLLLRRFYATIGTGPTLGGLTSTWTAAGTETTGPSSTSGALKSTFFSSEVFICYNLLGTDRSNGQSR